MVKQTLLLTGATGMVGSNILEHPLSNEWSILSPSSKELDLTDNEAVGNFFIKNKPHMVIHAAGYVGGIQANITDPVSFLDKNVSMSRNVIISAYRSGVKNFINLASTCMYPSKTPNPLSENMILTGSLEPTNEGYALAKIVSTRLCEYISRENLSFNYKTLIPCNLFGRYDQFNPSRSHLLPAIIHKVHQAKIFSENTVEIWGDGNARREFMYAGDVAEAILKASLSIEKIPNLMNIGIGHDFTISEYYEAVSKVIGWKGSFTYNTSRPVGMKQKLCSIERQTEWGWQPMTSLSHAINLTYQYYCKEVNNEL